VNRVGVHVTDEVIKLLGKNRVVQIGRKLTGLMSQLQESKEVALSLMFRGVMKEFPGMFQVVDEKFEAIGLAEDWMNGAGEFADDRDRPGALNLHAKNFERGWNAGEQCQRPVPEDPAAQRDGHGRDDFEEAGIAKPVDQ
jgi:hypothetical protein